MLRRRINFLLLFALLIPACSDQPPIPEKKFVEFYIQLQLIDTQYGTNAALQRQKVDSLMTAYRIDKKLFDSTMSWYRRTPERWEEFFAKVRERFDAMKPEYVRQKPR